MDQEEVKSAEKAARLLGGSILPIERGIGLLLQAFLDVFCES